MLQSRWSALQICCALFLLFALIGGFYLWPEITILIALVLVIVATVRYLRSLPEGKPTFLKKTWKWIKELWDAISGIG